MLNLLAKKLLLERLSKPLAFAGGLMKSKWGFGTGFQELFRKKVFSRLRCCFRRWAATRKSTVAYFQF